MAVLVPFPRFRAFDSSGNPLSGGKLYTYAAGTTTNQTTYTDQGGGTPNANPVILDSSGEANVWVDPTLSYKYVLKNSSDVQQWSVDNIRNPTSADLTFFQAGTGAVTRTIQSKLRDVVHVEDFGAVGNGVTDDTVAIQNAINYLSIGGDVHFGARTYKTTATLVLGTNVALIGQGVNTTTISYVGTSAAINIPGTITVNVVKNRIFGMAINGSAGSATGVLASYAPYFRFERVRVSGFTNGFAISDTWSATMAQCSADTCTQDGFNFGRDTNQISLIGCTAVSNTRAGYFIQGSRGLVLNDCDAETNGEAGVWISSLSAKPTEKVSVIGGYYEGNCTTVANGEVYVVSGDGVSSPLATTVRSAYFVALAAGKKGIYAVDANGLTVDDCLFSNVSTAYSYSLYVADSATPMTDVFFGSGNVDESTNGVYIGTATYVRNEYRLSARAHGRFTVAGAAISSSSTYGVLSVTYVSAGLYEVTLREALNANFTIVTDAENTSTVVGPLMSGALVPSSSTVFRIQTCSSAAVAAEAKTVRFVVYA